MSEPEWIKQAWDRPLPGPKEPVPDPPAPLEISPEDFRVIRSWLVYHGGESHPNQRVLVEILDCLRRIDDKLESLIRRGEPSARRTAGGK
jgi:hypothetical protein